MKKIINEQYQEVRYEKTLDNGLNVIIFEKPKFATSFFSMITPYGAADYQQVDDQGNMITLPSGVAHFLEHRMFDYEGMDVMNEFGKMGASCNAATSFDMTYYYFSTTNDVYRPLELLLDFVQEFSADEASVEKEKGIIIEELMMYQSSADQRLYFDLLHGMYVNHPYKDDLGGTKETVSATTLEQLQEAYAINYHPHQMYLVGSTNQDVEEVMAFIEKNQAQKDFDKPRNVTRNFDKEVKEVAIKKNITVMPVESDKSAVGFKFVHEYNDLETIERLDWGIKLYLETIFSSVNEAYQTWVDEERINDYFSFDFSLEEEVGQLVFFNENCSGETLYEFVMEVLKNHVPEERKFKQVQRKLLGRSIKSYEKPSSLAQAYGRSLVGGVDLFTSLELLADATMDEAVSALEELMEHADFSINEIKNK